jgi:hypothetical protein
MALVFTLPEKSQKKIEIEIMTLDPHGLKKSGSFQKGVVSKMGYYPKSWPIQ